MAELVDGWRVELCRIPRKGVARGALAEQVSGIESSERWLGRVCYHIVARVRVWISPRSILRNLLQEILALDSILAELPLS